MSALLHFYSYVFGHHNGVRTYSVLGCKLSSAVSHSMACKLIDRRSVNTGTPSNFSLSPIGTHATHAHNASTLVLGLDVPELGMYLMSYRIKQHPPPPEDAAAVGAGACAEVLADAGPGAGAG